MSPEQSRDFKDVDHRTDIFSLGKILYELLTGEVPYPAMDPALLDGGFRYVVEKATRLRPADRFFSVDEMIKEIELLTKKRDLLLPVLAHAQQLVAEAATVGDPATVRAAILFLKERPTDSLLHQEIVARLPTRVLELASRYCNDDLCDVIDAFCEVMSGPMTFSFVDVVADLLRTAFSACERLETKKGATKRLLSVGYSHNRYYVRTVVKQMVENLADDDEKLVFRDAVNECPDCHEWYKESFGSGTPEIIRQTLRQTES